MESYQRTKFTVKNWNEVDNGIRVELVPETTGTHGNIPKEGLFTCDTPNGLLAVIVPTPSRIAGELKRGAEFYLDLIPVELATAAKGGSRL